MSTRNRVKVILKVETIAAVADHAAANGIGFDEAYEILLLAGLADLAPIPDEAPFTAL